MTNVNSIDASVDAASDSSELSYQAVSALAIVAVVGGLLSPLAFLSPLLLVLPICVAGIALVALRRIDNYSPALVGRKPAILGLLLSLFCASAVGAQQISHRVIIDRQSRQFCDLWFDLLRQGDPERAYLMMVDEVIRPSLKGGVWDFYRQLPQHDAALRRFVQGPVVRALLELGPRAKVTYVSMPKHIRAKAPDGGKGEYLQLLYVVSYEDDGSKKSFFVELFLTRSPRSAADDLRWRLSSVDLAIPPAGFGTTASGS